MRDGWTDRPMDTHSYSVSLATKKKYDDEYAVILGYFGALKLAC